jgi:hypothetical protein
MGLLVNLYPCLQPRNSKQVAKHSKEKKKETLSQAENVWEKSCCVSTKLAKAMVKKLLVRVRLATDITGALFYVLFLQSLACFPKK